MAWKIIEKPKPKQVRGFACMSVKARKRIAAMGGTKTARRHGKKHMSRIGKAGRAKRTRREREEKRIDAKIAKNFKIAADPYPLRYNSDPTVSSS
jgi:hypothetical protein